LYAASIWSVCDESEPRCYWNADDIRVEQREEIDVIDELEAIWQSEVVRRVRPGQTPLLLSGGVDSRMVLSTLAASGVDLHAITFGDRDSSDFEIARQCARRAGIEQDELLIDQRNWWHGREAALWRIDGMISAMHLHAVASAHFGRMGNQCSPVNLAGNPLFAGDFITPAKHGAWNSSLGNVLKTFYRPNPWFSLEDVASSSETDLGGDLRGPSSTCFWIRRRTARFTINGPLSTACHYESSFVSPTLRLMECLLGGLSDQQRRNGKFYANWAMRHHSDFFADIPWQKTGRGLSESLLAKSRRLASNSLRALTFRRRRRKGIADYRQLAYAHVFGDRDEMADLLLDDLLGGGASKFLAQQREQFADPDLVLAIWSLEIYLRQVSLGRPASTQGAYEAPSIGVVR
jgi:hypothetical protein